jgi:Protein of unknown function (DUF4238)
MRKLQQIKKLTGRRDHFLPQGYLRGFIDPARSERYKPMWHFDIRTATWSEKSTRQVGYGEGFYDYATESPELIPADKVFARLEREFPIRRDELIKRGFDGWKSELGFFLDYMNMIKARSPLFLAQAERDMQRSTYGRVKSVDHATKQITYEPLNSSEIGTFVRNRTIVLMREQIDAGPSWMKEFHWCLRYAASPIDPVITADQPFVSDGPRNHPPYGIYDVDTLIYFPLCWQACLIGCVRSFDIGTDAFAPETLCGIRQRYRNNSKHFLVSPQPIMDASFVLGT